jgi:integrase
MAQKEKLTVAAVKSAVARAAPYKLADGGGLYLLVNPKGSKYWRYKYRYGGIEKVLAFGVFPEVGLQEARKRHQEARAQLREGSDPSQIRRVQKAAAVREGLDSFEAIAREWQAIHMQAKAVSYQERVEGVLQRFLLPYLGSYPVSQLTAPEVLAVLRRIEERSIDTRHRASSILGMIMRYAIATGRAERDPTPSLRGVLKTKRQQHYAAVTDPEALGHLLKAIDQYPGTAVVSVALKLTPLLFVRPGELRHMEWSEIDLAEARWDIPSEKMKGGQSHIVPLARRATELLKELYPLTGRGRFVFPSARGRSRPMSENAVRVALQSLECGKLTAHGFRATARTLLDEVLRERIDLIEHQLAHAVRDPLGRAYNRTAHLEERIAMMQRWADYLDELKIQVSSFGNNLSGK